MSERRVQDFAHALMEAHDFVGVATVICNQGKALFGLHHCRVTMFSSSGRPVLGVDNVVHGTDKFRIAYFSSLWVLAIAPYTVIGTIIAALG